jgi:hypothetical protein
MIAFFKNVIVFLDFFNTSRQRNGCNNMVFIFVIGINIVNIVNIIYNILKFCNIIV